nr:hypothetical protein [Paenibacillus xylanexedens]
MWMLLPQDAGTWTRYIVCVLLPRDAGNAGYIMLLPHDAGT